MIDLLNHLIIWIYYGIKSKSKRETYQVLKD
jgi:hypothetical protein